MNHIIWRYEKGTSNSTHFHVFLSVLQNVCNKSDHEKSDGELLNIFEANRQQLISMNKEEKVPIRIYLTCCADKVSYMLVNRFQNGKITVSIVWIVFQVKGEFVKLFWKTPFVFKFSMFFKHVATSENIYKIFAESRDNITKLQEYLLMVQVQICYDFLFSKFRKY